MLRAVDIVILAVEGILYAFSISVLIVLVAGLRSAFASPFYRILVIIILADFCYYIFVTLLVLRFPNFGLWTEFYRNNGWLASLDYALSVFLGYVQFVGHNLISLNRLTLFWFPLYHQKLWSRMWYVVVLLLVPFACSVFRLPFAGEFVFLPNGDVAVRYVNAEEERMAVLSSLIVYGTTTAVSLLLNVLLVTRYHHMRFRGQLHRVQQHDVKLLFFACLFFVVQFLRCVYMFVRPYFLLDPVALNLLQFLMPFLSDMDSWLAAVSLLFFSPTTRTRYRRFYCRRLKMLLEKSHGQQTSPPWSLQSK